MLATCTGVGQCRAQRAGEAEDRVQLPVHQQAGEHVHQHQDPPLLTCCLPLQVSDDAERSVLVKLKTECGYQFTSKLESMFTDIKTSRDTMINFRAHSHGQDAEVDLSVQVCAFGILRPAFWQLCLRCFVSGHSCRLQHRRKVGQAQALSLHNVCYTLLLAVFGQHKHLLLCCIFVSALCTSSLGLNLSQRSMCSLL